MNLSENREGKHGNENPLPPGFMLDEWENANMPDFVATGVQHVHVHVLHQNG